VNNAIDAGATTRDATGQTTMRLARIVR